MQLHLLPIYLAILYQLSLLLDSEDLLPSPFDWLASNEMMGCPQLRRNQVLRRKPTFYKSAESSRSITALHARGIAMCRTMQALGIERGHRSYVFRVMLYLFDR